MIQALSLLISYCCILDYYTFTLFLSRRSLMGDHCLCWHYLIKGGEIEDSLEPILHAGEHLILQSFHLLRTHVPHNIITALYIIIRTIYCVLVSNYFIDIPVDDILIAYPCIIGPLDLGINSSASVAVGVVDEDLVTDARGQ